MYSFIDFLIKARGTSAEDKRLIEIYGVLYPESCNVRDRSDTSVFTAYAT
jgi:hypothetical protein